VERDQRKKEFSLEHKYSISKYFKTSNDG